MWWTPLFVITVFLAPASDGFFFGGADRRRDRPPVGRRRDSWTPRPYWDWTWNRPYYQPSSALRRFHRGRLDEYHRGAVTNSYYPRNPYYRRDSYYRGNSYSPSNSYHTGNSYYRGNDYHGGNAYHRGNAYHMTNTYRGGNSHQPHSSYYTGTSYYGQPNQPHQPATHEGRHYTRHSVGRKIDHMPAGTSRVADTVLAAEGSGPPPEGIPAAPATAPNTSVHGHSVEENVTEEEKAHNYMRNTELLVKIATRFDTYGCFRRLVCECEYYSSRLRPSERTLEEKLILHVFGMDRRRQVGDMDRARFHHAAAVGEAAREQGLPDPCPAMAPKCPQNMVKKLWSRHAEHDHGAV